MVRCSSCRSSFSQRIQPYNKFPQLDVLTPPRPHVRGHAGLLGGLLPALPGHHVGHRHQGLHPGGRQVRCLGPLEHRCCTFNYTALHSAALYYTVLHYALLHCTALYCTVLYCALLYCTTLHCTAQCTAQYTAQPTCFTWSGAMPSGRGRTSWRSDEARWAGSVDLSPKRSTG